MEAANGDNTPSDRARSERYRLPWLDGATRDSSGALDREARQPPGQIDREVGEVPRLDRCRIRDAPRRAPCGIAREITPVCRHGVAREPTLDSAMVEIVPDHAIPGCRVQASTSEISRHAMPKDSATAG